MTIALNPYLQFDGEARDAMEFYHHVLGGELSLLTYGDGMGETNPDRASKLMHSSLFGGRGIHIMASDVAPGLPMGSNGTVSLSSDDADGGDAEALTSWWELLLEDAEVTMPLEQAPWGDHYGQLTDKFGVQWMISIPASQS